MTALFLGQRHANNADGTLSRHPPYIPPSRPYPRPPIGPLQRKCFAEHVAGRHTPLIHSYTHTLIWKLLAAKSCFYRYFTHAASYSLLPAAFCHFVPFRFVT